MMPQAYDPREVCFGIVKSLDRNLINLINKAILATSAEELQTIVYANSFNPRVYTLAEFVRMNSVTVISVVISVFTVLLGLLLVILRQRGHAAHSASLELEKHLRLYAVAGDTFFEYDYRKQRLMYASPGREVESNRRIIPLMIDEPTPDGQHTVGHQAFKDLLRAAENQTCDLYAFVGGANHWMHITLETIRDAAGMPIYAVGRMNYIDQQKEETELLRDRAERDSLTHLYNTAACRSLISQSLAKLDADEMGALLLIDVDAFKAINDTRGHMQGDDALRRVASLLQRQFRATDILGRPGGDEFAVYMTRVKDEAALATKCEELCAAAYRLYTDEALKITLSVGAAISFKGQSYEALYAAADRALYAAKSGGKGLFKIAPQDDAGDKQGE